MPRGDDAESVSTRARWIWDPYHRQTPNQLVLFRRTVSLPTPVVAAEVDVAARGSFRVWANGAFVAHLDVQSPEPGSDAIRIDLAPALGGTATTVELVIGVHLLGVGTHHQPQAVGGLHVVGSARSAHATIRLDSSSAWQARVPTAWRQTTPQMHWTTGYAEWWDYTTPDAGRWEAAVEYPDTQTPELYDRLVRETPVDLLPCRVEQGSCDFGSSSAASDDSGVLPFRVEHGACDRPPDGPGHGSRAAQFVALGTARQPDAARRPDATRQPDAAPGPDAPQTDAARQPDAARQLGATGRDWSYHLFALDREQVGFLEVELDVAAPTTVDVGMGEAADATGWPTATRQGIDAVDTITLPAGRTRHRFWHRRAFRHLALVLRPAGPHTLVSATFHTVTAARPQPTFEPADPLEAAVFATSQATAAVGRQDFYEDCPLREGGHYVADARVQALLDLLSTGEARLAQRSLRQFARAQDPDGMTPALSPSGTNHRLPDFALQWVCYLDDYTRLTGDQALLSELRPNLDAALAWAEAQWDDSTGHFRTDRPGWWSFIDWHRFPPDALQAALDAQFIVSLHAGGDLLSRLGDTAQAQSLHVRAATRLPGAALEHPHAAAILLSGLPLDLLPDDRYESVLRGFTADTGYFNFWLCVAHLNAGRRDAARRIVTGYWGAMLEAGATTWWERFAPGDRAAPVDASLCHPWSAGPLILLPIIHSDNNPLAHGTTK